MISTPTAAIAAQSISIPSLASTHYFSITLTSKNYLLWKAQFIPILNYQKLYEFIDGSSPISPRTIAFPTDPTMQIPNPAFFYWFFKDQMLHS
uniref:Uncharacterized protein n=1 Tax=Manihot esculenta TaxID=3983 RepID=A0A2C9UVY0_MANES